MKKILLILAISIAIAGCKTTKKLTTSDVKTSTETETNKKTESSEKQNVDFNVKTKGENLNIKIEFAEPSPDNTQGEQNGENTNPTKPSEPINTGNPIIDNVLNNLGAHGPVKSVAINSSKTETIDSTKAEVNKAENSEENTNAKSDYEAETTVKEKSKPSKWIWWVFGAVAAAGVVVVWKWKKIRDWIIPMIKFVFS